MKKIFSLLFLLILCNSSFAQTKVITGKIIDFISNKEIPNVNIYSIKLNAGTITNADGDFSIIVADEDELHISYVGCENQIIKLSDSLKEHLVIKMKLKVERLDEIVIKSKPLTVEIILDKVFKSFKKNHFVEPVYYKFYDRIISYKKDSTLNLIEEYTGTIFQNRMHNTKYNIEKGRIKYLTKDSIEQLKNHRVISMNKIFTDNIFRFREKYIKSKGKFSYSYKLIGKSNLFGRNCYVIEFFTDENTYYKKGLLYIDMKDFAISRKILKDSDNQLLSDISFKKDNDKWYLKKTEEYHNSFDAPTITQYRITIYNNLNVEKSNLKFVKLLSGEFSKNYIGDFNDEFWVNNNFIPLPNWIKKQIK